MTKAKACLPHTKNVAQEELSTGVAQIPLEAAQLLEDSHHVQGWLLSGRLPYLHSSRRKQGSMLLHVGEVLVLDCGTGKGLTSSESQACKRTSQLAGLALSVAGGA